MNDTYQRAVNIGQQELLIEQQRLIRAKTEGLTVHQQSARASQSQESKYRDQNVVLQKALDDANNLVLEWQSAMEAWKDLAQVLRDEIKACPNHEAHGFGKDQAARNQHRNRKEDEARVSKKLAPVFSPLQKGLTPA